MRTICFTFAVLFLAGTIGRADLPASVPAATELVTNESGLFASGVSVAPSAWAEQTEADPTEMAGVPGWFWTYVPDVVWSDWREIIT